MARSRIAIVVLLVASALGAVTPAARAMTLTVNKTTDDNGPCDFNDCALREAIIAANGSPAADTIVLPAGYYKLSPALGSLTISQPLAITGAGSGNTEVVGNEYAFETFAGSIFQATTTGSVSLSDFAVRGGNAGGDNGGGIHSPSSALTLRGMHVLNNVAGNAGGIDNGGTLTLISTSVAGNTAFVGGGILNDNGAIANLVSSDVSGNGGEDAEAGGGISNSGTVKITSSTVSGNSASNGGGILNFGTLDITSSTVSGNQADTGGGIRNSGGTVELSSSTVTGNTATGDGGGLRNDGPANVTSSTLSGNHAANGGAIHHDPTTDVGIPSFLIVESSRFERNSATNMGGAIFNNYVATIASSTLTENTATNGGAIANEGGQMGITSTLVSKNQASTGGGITNDGQMSVSSSTLSGNRASFEGGAIEHVFATLNVVSSTLSDNLAFSGGGIFNRGSGGGPSHEITVASSTFSRNFAGFSGGGVYNEGGAEISSSTFSGNSASSHGGGIANVPASMPTVAAVATVTTSTLSRNSDGIVNSGLATLTSSIVAANTDADCAGVTSGGFNVFGSSTGCPSGGTDQSTADASFLGPLANNGGPTETHRISPGSAPVGNAAPDPACDGTTTDQRGVPRPNDACDAGAYELTFCRGQTVNVVGTNGSDNLAGTHGPDGILAQGGNDKANGGDGNDAVCGGSGKDKLTGAGGNDTLDGGPGTDTCIGNAGNDKFKACETAKQ